MVISNIKVLYFIFFLNFASSYKIYVPKTDFETSIDSEKSSENVPLHFFKNF